MRKVIATAPTRVDLAGGTLDLPPLYLFHPGALTVNAAIDQLATCEVTTRADTSIVLVSRDVGQREVYPSREALRLDTPLQLLARLVAFCTVGRHRGHDGVRCATWFGTGRFIGAGHRHGRGIESSDRRWLHPGATVDAGPEYRNAGDSRSGRGAGLLSGGVWGHQRHSPGSGGVCHESLAADWLPWLDAHVVVCHTGQAHFSGTNNWEIFKRHIEGDLATQAALARIRDLARAMYAAVCARDLGAVAAALEQEWHHRRQLAAEVSTPTIERLMAVARESGALAGKVCGAGGGGCVVFVVAEGRKPDVQAALTAAGGQVLDAHLTTQGLTVTEV